MPIVLGVTSMCIEASSLIVFFIKVDGGKNAYQVMQAVPTCLFRSFQVIHQAPSDQLAQISVSFVLANSLLCLGIKVRWED